MENNNSEHADQENIIMLSPPKRKKKPRIFKNFRNLFCKFLIVGILFFCFSTINIIIEIPDDIIIRRTRGKSTSFKPLRDDLRFDIPSEQYYQSPQFNMPDVKAERKDWHNYAAMAADEQRIGPGEQGKPTINTDEAMKVLEKQYIEDNHYNGYISNIISVNRSLPNLSLKKCLTKRYLAKLPVVSIVMPCRNELFSVLQRSLHSIINRTPPELLKEIIIVDDHSFRGYSVGEMLFYSEHHLRNLVHFIKLPKRMGLVHARTAGAQRATGDVIVFLDSHIECTHNWLPPLLEPIAINDRIATTPVIDIVDFKTFEYRAAQTTRGGYYNWTFDYTQFQVYTGPNIDESMPYKEAVMQGGLFAISRKFFWKLGGYDRGLDTWGSENSELSLKIWTCGGMLLAVPCSRVGHIWIVPHSNKVSPTDSQSMQRNAKRVAEVWMDEYKHYFYMEDPEFWYNLDAGKLTEQHALRKRLKCKPFKWFMDFVAPDFRTEHPFDLPPDYANGTIQSVAFSNYCLDTLGQSPIANVGLFQCAENSTCPHRNQLWNFNVRQEVKNFRRDICLDMFHTPPNARVSLHSCTREKGNQFWYYDSEQKWIVHKENGTQCMEALKFDDGDYQVVVNECVRGNKQMQWIFGFVNKMNTPSKFVQKIV